MINLTCTVVNSLGVEIRSRTDEYLRYLSGPDIAGPEEGGPVAGVPELQAGSAHHQQTNTVRPPLSGSMVQGSGALTVLDMSDIRDQGKTENREHVFESFGEA